MSEQRFQATLDPYLPWDPLPGESRRIRILMAIFVGFAVVWTLVQPHIKIPVETRAQQEAVPERLATLVLEEKQKPPPPPPKPVEELQKPDETKPKEAEKPKEVPQVEPVEPKAVQMDAKTAAARARAKQEIDNAGIQDQLSDLRDMSFDSEPKPAGAAAGPGAGLITDTQAAGTSRNLIGSRAGTGSGGSAALGYNGSQSSGFGGGAAGGKGSKGGALGLGNGKVATVQSKIASDLAVAGPTMGKDGKSQRSQESVAKGFDVIGGRLNAAYQKALRDNPNLVGGVTLKLTITADGGVTSCTIAASELNEPTVEGKICTIVKSFNFGSEGNDTWTGKYLINFHPGD
jgi:hypothetical protein